MKDLTTMLSKQVEEIYNNETWERLAFNEVRGTFQDLTFPCHFARIAELKGSTYYAFADSATNADDLEHAARCLKEFTDMVKGQQIKKRYTLLLVLKPEEELRSNEHYAEIFWNLLKYLHEHDYEEWPARVSTDPNNGDFEFCYNGSALFTFANTPAYRQKLSRNLGKSLVIVFVPASSFFGVKLLTPGGIAARKLIRERLDKYDSVEHSPDFGEIDEGIPLAWKAYFIADKNIPITTGCPFKFKGEGKKEVY